MSIFQPVSFAARRAFWPSLPMASDSWLSGTTTREDFSLSATNTLCTRAGLSAEAIYSLGSLDHLTISIFSVFNSFTTFSTRMPRGPTHAPTGSMLLSVENTAIFVRKPASRAMDLICTTPLRISGTSISNRRFTSPGCVRETITCGPRFWRETSSTYTFRRSPTLISSPGICCACSSTPSVRPSSTNARPFSTRCTMAVRISFSFSMYSS